MTGPIKNLTRCAGLLVFCLGLGAADSSSRIQWTAYSETARVITGDIILSNSEIDFGSGKKLKLKYLGKEKGISSAPGVPDARLYRIEGAANVTLGDSKTLCGGALPTYIGTVEIPLTPYELSITTKINNARFCADYIYVRDYQGP
jgi:hypothetical protein